MKDFEQETSKACAIYGRTAVSNPVALEAQIATCRAKAHENEWTCDRRYIFGDDGVSSNSRLCDRRGLSALFASLTNRGDRVHYLLISDLNRLSRNVSEILAMIDALTQIGVTVYAVDNSLDMSLPASMMWVELNHTLAQTTVASKAHAFWRV
jgi:DNA invertase Pin-like site-specific DNA recombinase